MGSTNAKSGASMGRVLPAPSRDTLVPPDANDDRDCDGTTAPAPGKSLAHLASSPERIAESCGMRPRDVRDAIRRRREATLELNERVIALDRDNCNREDGANSPQLTPAELGRAKHRLICRHRYDHLRKPLVCRRCWTHLPICVCHLFEEERGGARNGDCDPSEEKERRRDSKKKSSLPRGVDRVIVWTHHEEWGRTSNTGSLLPLALERTEMLMKGLEEHDEIMDGLLSRDDLTPVILWPGKGGVNNATTVSELRSMIADGKLKPDDGGEDLEPGEDRNDQARLVIVAVEGTWTAARKMVNKLPPHALRLDLGDDVIANFTMPEMNDGIFCNSTYPNGPVAHEGSSLLAPLRSQRNGSAENVSTLEAAVVALLALGLGVDDAGRVLRIARTKVERIYEYVGRGKQRLQR